jgi:hypothetical protein
MACCGVVRSLPIVTPVRASTTSRPSVITTGVTLKQLGMPEIRQGPVRPVVEQWAAATRKHHSTLFGGNRERGRHQLYSLDAGVRLTVAGELEDGEHERVKRGDRHDVPPRVPGPAQFCAGGSTVKRSRESRSRTFPPGTKLIAVYL